MSIEAINEQLLRSVGVGIALFSENENTLEFGNDVFLSWFGEAIKGKSLEHVFPDLDSAAMRRDLDATGSYVTEFSFRQKRRTLVVSQSFTRAVVDSQPLIILECQNITRIRELESMIESYSNMVERNTREIQREKERVEKLLLNIMPRSAYDEYKDFGVVAPQRYDSVSMLTLEFTDFSDKVETLAPATLISEINELFSAFDRIGEQLSCERIRTTGDTYRCIAGMQDPDGEHSQAVAKAAVRFIRYLKRRNEDASIAWRCRIGLGTGSVVGSVLGNQKYVFDVFGEAVDAAEEARSIAGDMEILATDSFLQPLPEGLARSKVQIDSALEAGLVSLEEA